MAAKDRGLRPRDHAPDRKAGAAAAIDQKWRDHLLTLEHLRSVVGFRGYAQRDPLSEYKTEASSCLKHAGRAAHRRDPAAVAHPPADRCRTRTDDAPISGPAGPATGSRCIPQHEEAEGGEASAHRPASTKPTPRPGATPRAMTRAPAARARSSTRFMPTRRLCRCWFLDHCFWRRSLGRGWHNQRASRKARRLSVGRKRPGFMVIGAVLSRALSLICRSACR
jgi:hypothetical protein